MLGAVLGGDGQSVVPLVSLNVSGQSVVGAWRFAVAGQSVCSLVSLNVHSQCLRLEAAESPLTVRPHSDGYRGVLVEDNCF